MKMIKFDHEKCTLCERCILKCPFNALSMGEKEIEVSERCRMCGACIRVCPHQAISFEQKARSFNKEDWNDFLIYAEQERGEIHPVVYELIGEARKMAKKIGYKVNCLLIGSNGIATKANELLEYGVDSVYVYEDECFENFRADCYTEACVDCIAKIRPSSVLIGATVLGRTLAPCLSTRFHTGLTADCTKLDIRENTDLVQIRPAFGGNIMAQIRISNSRPQFATVRYRVMEKATKTNSFGNIVMCEIPQIMKSSKIEVLSTALLEKKQAIENAEIIVAIGRGADSESGIQLGRELAKALNATLAFTRPMVEEGRGTQSHQIGLSGHTVKPKLIITAGVSGAVQFTTCMKDAEMIVAINSDKNAPIFNIADYCIVDDLYTFLPKLIEDLKKEKEVIR